MPLDDHPAVEAWVKNDHLGFEIRYSHAGSSRNYTPDFIIKLKQVNYLIVEIRGRKTPTNQAKQNAAKEWIGAVNSLGKFGTWHFVSIDGIGQMKGVLDRYR